MNGVTLSRGIFVVVEGPEGSGKTAQSPRVAARLDALHTREPGGTPLAERMRNLVLEAPESEEREEVDPVAELFLMCAGRAQHVARVLEPTLAAGRNVLCERFSGSTLAYQGLGRGLPFDTVLEICRFAERGTAPDVVVYLDAPASVRAERMRERKLDRIEQAGRDFHQRVEDAFERLADELGWVRVDGVGSIDEVTDRIVAAIRRETDVPGA